MSHLPFDQFKIKPLIDINMGSLDLSFTNSSLFMSIAAAVIILFFYIASRKATLVPSRLQSSAEIMYEFVGTTLQDGAGSEGRKFFPLIFCLFLFVLSCNLLGLVPYGFTVTSHLATTFILALGIFLLVTIIGIYKHGMHFLKMFLPSGTPLWLAPMMILIELFSYLSKPVSLSVRLAANMIAGHVLLKVLAGYIITLGIMWGWIPIPLIVVVTGLEIFVAILQAYIFTILSCVYIGNALQLH